MKAVLVREDALVTQVAQAIVPVEVIVPPVIGDVVAMLLTPPPAVQEHTLGFAAVQDKKVLFVVG